MAGRDMERVVELGALIVKLRSELRAHERELSILLAVTPVAAAVEKKKRLEKSAAHETGSTTAKIMRLLRDHPKDVFDATEVARHLGAKVESVRTMLKRLVSSGDIRKTGRGAFRA